jgi:hypothetical protein
MHNTPDHDLPGKDETSIELAADAGLPRDNPSRLPENQEKLRLGQEAMTRIGRGWGDWMIIAEAIEVGRTEAMQAANANEPRGKRYEREMGDWLTKNGFRGIDKGARSRLLDCLEQRAAIEKWRSTLTEAERIRLNHPSTVLRKWKTKTVVPDPNAKRKPSPVAKYKEEIARLEEENHRLLREEERRARSVNITGENASEAASITDERGQTLTQTEEDQPGPPNGWYVAISIPPNTSCEQQKKLGSRLHRLERDFGATVKFRLAD